MVTFSQTFKIYELFNKYFRNEEDAKTLASEIEFLVTNKLNSEIEDLATKKDLVNMEVRLKGRYCPT